MCRLQDKNFNSEQMSVLAVSHQRSSIVFAFVIVSSGCKYHIVIITFYQHTEVPLYMNTLIILGLGEFRSSFLKLLVFNLSPGFICMAR